MNKKTKLAILGVIGLVLVTLSLTYAYWLITRTQTKENVITAGCLDISLSNEKNDISLTEQFPISDDEGKELTPYTFTVTNNCNTAVDYYLNLEALGDSDSAISASSLKVMINDYEPTILGDNPELKPTIIDAYTSYILEFGTLSAKENADYKLRLWIDEEAPISEMNKVFNSKISVTVGQGIIDPNLPTADACFEFDETTGEITKYLNEKEDCGTKVIIPETINGVQVKSVDKVAFKGETSLYYDLNNKPIDSIDMTNVNFAIVNTNDGQTYVITYTTDENILTELTNLFITEGITEENIFASTDDNIPELKVGDQKTYANIDSSNNITGIGIEFMGVGLIINSLDLSQANYLEVIEPGAFSNIAMQEVKSGSCTYDTVYLKEYNDVSQIPPGLNNLKFGKQDEIKIGSGAFAGLKMDKLNIYTNIKGYKECSDQIVAYSFFGANVNKLNVYPLENNAVINPGQFLLANMFADNLIIRDGITEIGEMAFGLTWMSNLRLPDSLNAINSGAFAVRESSTLPEMNITIPYNVTYIGEYAFDYRKGTITFLRTKDNVNANVTLGNNWSRGMTVKYAD